VNSADQTQLEALLSFAVEAIQQAGDLTLRYYQTGTPEDRKGDNTPVTVADREAEQLLRRLIAERWPDHGILGEEYGEERPEAPIRWIIDPIDGTRSFVCGVPLYANLLACVEGDRTLAGVMHFPALGDTLTAARGLGCSWNGRPARVSEVDQLAEAVVLTSQVGSFGDKTEAWGRLCEASYIQRTWGDAYGYALVATGRAEVMVDPQVKIWDIAPMPVILEEAGGTFTDWAGIPTITSGAGVATNGKLLKQTLALL
jgi:histidinol-phosphatase